MELKEALLNISSNKGLPSNKRDGDERARLGNLLRQDPCEGVKVCLHIIQQLINTAKSQTPGSSTKAFNCKAMNVSDVLRQSGICKTVAHGLEAAAAAAAAPQEEGQIQSSASKKTTVDPAEANAVLNEINTFLQHELFVEGIDQGGLPFVASTSHHPLSQTLGILSWFIRAITPLAKKTAIVTSAQGREWLSSMIPIPEGRAEQVTKILFGLCPTDLQVWQAFIKRLCDQGGWDVIQQILEQWQMDDASKRAIASTIIHAMRQAKQFKKAYIQAPKWKVVEEFPDGWLLFKEHDLRDKVIKGKWGIAEALLPSKSPDELQRWRRIFIKILLDEGLFGVAHKLVMAYGFKDIRIDPALILQEKEDRAAKYCTLGLPREDIVLVDSEDSIERGARLLLSSFTPLSSEVTMDSSPQAHPLVCGLDVEFVLTLPSYMQQKGSAEGEGGRGEEVDATIGDPNAQIASILQLSTRTCAVIIDLLAIKASASLIEAFRRLIADPLLANPEVIKTGFDLRQDLTVLRGFCPMHIKSIVDLRDMGSNKKLLSHTFKKNDSSLSRLTESYLGKGLDKMQQTSNWSRRPLDEDQIAYAALDAHVCVLVFDEMVERLTEQRNITAAAAEGGGGGERQSNVWSAYIKNSTSHHRDSSSTEKAPTSRQRYSMGRGRGGRRHWGKKRK